MDTNTRHPDNCGTPERSIRSSAEPASGKPDAQNTSLDSGGMTLEQVIELTGELEHLNDLVKRRLELAGGFTDTAAYFKTVHPVLDMLEIEIRVKCTGDTTATRMKEIVRDWIDREIRDLK